MGLSKVGLVINFSVFLPALPFTCVGKVVPQAVCPARGWLWVATPQSWAAAVTLILF